MTNPEILRQIKRHIFTDGTILEDLERSGGDAGLRDKVIQVGEFQNCDLQDRLTDRRTDQDEDARFTWKK